MQRSKVRKITHQQSINGRAPHNGNQQPSLPSTSTTSNARPASSGFKGMLQKSEITKNHGNTSTSVSAGANKIKRKNTFDDFDFKDLNCQPTLKSFSLTDSFNVSTDCKNAFSGKNEENAILDGVNELSDWDDDILEPIAINGPASNLSEDDKNGIIGTIKSDDSLKNAKTVDKKVATNEATNFSDLLDDDEDFDFEELCDIKSSQFYIEQKQKKKENSSSFHTAAGTDIELLSDKALARAHALFADIENIFLAEIACLLWMQNNGQQL